MSSLHFLDAEICFVTCNVYGEFASILKPKEYIRSYGIEELIFRFTSTGSYRDSTELLNRCLHREGQKTYKIKTISDHVVSTGVKLAQQYEALSSSVLTGNGFSEDGLTVPSDLSALTPPDNLFDDTDPKEYFKDTIDSFNTGKPEEMKIKDMTLVEHTEVNPDECVYIFLDDVGVKHQKDTRKDGGTKESKNVENTVIRIKSGGLSYTITAVGMGIALKQLLAFLLFNNLLQTKKLLFFSDGARNIKKGLEDYFGSFNYQLRLDWYHLELHLDQALSLALWKKYRQALQPSILSMLWAGNIDEAIAFLELLKENKKVIKSQTRLQEAIDYLKRKKPYIDCYAIRKESGYINSSNPAEKENDLVVAQRQKHNGMAWSYDGSSSLAVINAAMRNDEFYSWMHTGSLNFSFSTIRA